MTNINLSITGNIARLQLNRPEVFNAMSPDLLQELIDLCARLSADEAAKVVILEGVGKHFCAGADLPEFRKRTESDPQGTADLGRRATNALAELPQITIAAMKGHCIGGALVLAAVCDLRVAAEGTRFAIPELDAGIPLSWGGTPHLVRLVGETMANDLVLTCRPFGPDDALRAAFISRIFAKDDFVTEVGALAENVAAKPQIVLRQTKQKMLNIRAGTFDARNDAGEMLVAMNDPEADAVGREYLRRILGK